MRQGPLARHYPAVALMVVLALVPYLALSAALNSLTPIIAGQLRMSVQTVGLAAGLANAGYAVGTILAVQLAQHRPQRRMLLIYGCLLVIGSVLAAAATGPAMFIVGHVLQGLCTSLLLIAAVPPLILGYSLERMRETAMIMNMCIFGAVALGPVVGGIQANAHGWRPLFWIIAGIAAAALVLSLLTFEDDPPANPDAPRDPLAIGLSLVGCVAAFYGASELLTHSFRSPGVWIPLLGGLALIVALVVHEYTSARPLLCVKGLVSTFPIAGITAAVCAAAASVSAIALTGVVLTGRYSPLHLGLLYLPEFAGAVLTAIMFGIVFKTRLLHYYALTGMLVLAIGILVVNGASPPTGPLVAVGSGLIGIGVGASVVPALFIAGFSLRSSSIQRVFALIELVRAVAAFMVAPILLRVAQVVGSDPAAGTRTALWICFGISILGASVAVGLYRLGGVRPPQPALERWRGGVEPAWDSPPLLAARAR
ncbi:MFS transporter [Actinospica durhamensis]|uniref:MFS transporter n=1 Tax=Actinospica durhamensis TaxID=1508375 RepID=A0A941ITY4_9ACTN|nr:MFS transporter [Actinospica durhamensis]MBR7836608.1 MFS transporter [Actinospica durhamensis]